MLVGSTAFVPFGYVKMDEVRNVWRDAYLKMESIQPTTDLEATLRETAMLATDAITHAWNECHLEALWLRIFVLWSVGFTLIGFSRREKTWQDLLRKVHRT